MATPNSVLPRSASKPLGKCTHFQTSGKSGGKSLFINLYLYPAIMNIARVYTIVSTKCHYFSFYNLSKKTSPASEKSGFANSTAAWHHVEAVLCDPKSVVSSDLCTVGSSLDLPLQGLADWNSPKPSLVVEKKKRRYSHPILHVLFVKKDNFNFLGKK